MESTTRVQHLDEAICISLHANALGKIMNPPGLSQLWVKSSADWVL